ncbi:c-type heme family protein [Marimonas arenosa]|uniref:DUF3365 domain-containing protein n=1 Tax=Marimonas arenosa TaxID=1795305 RepID=A0AAE3WDG4_9RHOB|nr:DUF3365 domain-containing protein [Marimonas arenosa]MDQ2091246.1 DUF3365 domain-containing protein [Marimonas arenosa]
MKTTVTALAIGIAAWAGMAAAADKAALVEEGKGVMMQFGGALKKELVAAIEAGGPVNGISVCNTKAPEIAAQVSGATGWRVARSSHKLRNPENAADAFTAAAIEEFLAREAKGEKAEDMAKAAIVEENGRQVFRLVKAIPTAAVCLNCHGGDKVQQSVVDKLAELYPEDTARGFEEGQMRGVFTLMKALD